MTIKMYQVDAFTSKLFGGNPAAVCLLEDWLEDELMQNIASENNLSETAFLVPEGDIYGIRWFTPAYEVDLCGHATLASGHVILNYVETDTSQVNFYSHRSGPLSVTKVDNRLVMDFPVDDLEAVVPPAGMEAALGVSATEVYQGKTDYMVVLHSQSDIENLNPDFGKLSAIEARGVIVTAPGNEVDFVSRFFAPQAGVHEDPVTGSAHTTLTPYWAEKLEKQQLVAKQLSQRGGSLQCNLKGDRVELIGQAETYMIAEIFV